MNPKPLSLAIACAASAACAPVPVARVEPAAMAIPFQVDTHRVQRLAPGASHRFIYSSSGPWAINVLDVNRDSCYSAVALKGFSRAAGRKRTSELLAELDSNGVVVGGVNADFFSPNGTPTNAHVSRGKVVSGPNGRPALAFDSTGAPGIGSLTVHNRLAADGFAGDWGWNRPRPNGISIFDANWGTSTDSASNAVEVVVSGRVSYRSVRVDTLTAGVPIPADGAVIVFRGRARSRGLDLMGRRDSGQISWDPVVTGAPREAVGGRPILVRDSVVVPGLDTAGGAGFAAGRHPRTAAGIAHDGRRLLLVTVDGRQKPYSDGMTLRELATLMLSLGARDAINLDGGGSTTMVYKPPRDETLTLANRPSDRTGERAVGNALAIVRGCAARR